MRKDKLSKIGWWGTAMTGVCCFTPVLPWALGLVGLTLIIPYLDYILFPLLFLFFGIALWGWQRARRARQGE